MFIQVFQVQLRDRTVVAPSSNVAPGDQAEDNRFLGIHFRRHRRGVHDHFGSIQVGGGRES